LPDINEINARLVEEFRAHSGEVAGMPEGIVILLLHHLGARTGIERVNPLAYQRVGDSYAIFASANGGTAHPDWYFNLKSNPTASIEIGTDVVEVSARELGGVERAAVWRQQVKQAPMFSEYEERTEGIREIPVFLLERSSPAAL
jgi:deazaflavin-dependent oxidoreductase (nitroreductase family)